MSATALHVLVMRPSPRTSSHMLRRLVLDECAFRDRQRRSWLLVEAPPLRQDDDEQVAVVLGLSGKVTELVHEARVTGDGKVSIIRRFTGGGTVAVDSNVLLVSLATSVAKCKPYPREIMKFTIEDLFAPAFAMAAAGGQGLIPPLELRENDYVVGNYKVGGNAQALVLSPQRFLHHTSFLWKVEERAMSFLKMPTKKPLYRAERSHTEFLTGLQQSIPGLELERLTDAIIHSCAKALGATEVVLHENDEELWAESQTFIANTRNSILFDPNTR